MNETRMSRRLGELVAPFLERVAAASVDDMRARYDFGGVLGALREVRGAEGLVDMIARRLEVDASALRRYARTHEVIPASEFEWLMGLRTRLGGAITWSHVELLAREPDKKKRMALAKAIAREDLSVRDLSARVVQTGRG
jgi:hypothetical protein